MGACSLTVRTPSIEDEEDRTWLILIQDMLGERYLTTSTQSRTYFKYRSTDKRYFFLVSTLEPKPRNLPGTSIKGTEQWGSAGERLALSRVQYPHFHQGRDRRHDNIWLKWPRMCAQFACIIHVGIQNYPLNAVRKGATLQVWNIEAKYWRGSRLSGVILITRWDK